MKKIWDERFLALAEMVGGWTNCVRQDRKIGAVIAKDNEILSIGYNKVPEGLTPCTERGECIRKQNKVPSGTHLEICFGICAEQYAIMQALKTHKDISGATIYVTHSPCASCARWIINAGIKRVVYKDAYPDAFSLQLLSEAGIKCDNVK